MSDPDHHAMWEAYVAAMEARQDALPVPDPARVEWCRRRGIDPFEIVADGGCEAWMAVTDHGLRQDLPS